MSYATGYVCALTIFNCFFTCAYHTVGNHRMAIATGATTAGCFLAALVMLVALP